MSERIGGDQYTQWDRDIWAREAEERRDHNDRITTVWSLYEAFKAAVYVQTKGASGDWSGFVGGMEELADELPARME